MVEQPATLIASPAGGRASTWPPAGLDQSDVEIRSQLLEPANQAAASQSCTDNGEINLSHVC
jgi:hypothetical protein